MSDKRIHITDLGHRHIFIEADVPKEIFTQLLQNFSNQGFLPFGVCTGAL